MILLIYITGRRIELLIGTNKSKHLTKISEKDTAENDKGMK